MTVKANFVLKNPLVMDELSVYGMLKCQSPLIFEVKTFGGVDALKYSLYILKDGKIYFKEYASTSDRFSYSFTEPGTYIVVSYCDDSMGQRVSKRKTVTVL